MFHAILAEEAQKIKSVSTLTGLVSSRCRQIPLGLAGHKNPDARPTKFPLAAPATGINCTTHGLLSSHWIISQENTLIKELFGASCVLFLASKQVRRPSYFTTHKASLTEFLRLPKVTSYLKHHHTHASQVVTTYQRQCVHALLSPFIYS